MRRRVALLPLLALLALPAPATAAGRADFGLDVAEPIGDRAAFLRDLRTAKAAGLSTIRFEVNWSRVEPERGRFDPGAVAELDAAARAARERGLRLHLLFLRSPCWASEAPAGADCQKYGPRDPADAVGVATFLAGRYAAQASAFEIWNEPDHKNELYWAGPDKVTGYVALVKALYGPLKQAAPNVPVLAGAFVGTNGAWLKALYDAGMKGHYDGISAHFYDLTLAGLRTTRAVMRRHGDTVPVWLGETGWTSCFSRRVRTQTGHACVDRATQARQTADLVRALRRTSWVRGAVFYTARDDAQYDFGLVDRAGRAKPVLAALRAELRTRSPRATRKLTVRLRRSGRALVATGTGPGADVLTYEARGGRFIFKGTTRLGPKGRYAVRIPPQLGTRGVSIRVRQPWTGRRARARR